MRFPRVIKVRTYLATQATKITLSLWVLCFVCVRGLGGVSAIVTQNNPNVFQAEEGNPCAVQRRTCTASVPLPQGSCSGSALAALQQQLEGSLLNPFNGCVAVLRQSCTQMVNGGGATGTFLWNPTKGIPMTFPLCANNQPCLVEEVEVQCVPPGCPLPPVNVGQPHFIGMPW